FRCTRPLISSVLLIFSAVAERWDPAGGSESSCIAAEKQSGTGAGLCSYAPVPPCNLLSDAELVDDRTVALEVRLLEVVEKAAAPADELEKAAAAVMIFRVGLEMFREIGNTIGEERDLNFRRAGVTLVGGKARDQLRLLL